MIYDYQIREEDRPLIISKLTDYLSKVHNQSWQRLATRHAMWMLHRRALFGGFTTHNLYRILLSIRIYINQQHRCLSTYSAAPVFSFDNCWLVELGDRLIPKPMSWYASRGEINEDNVYDQYNRTVMADLMCQSLEVTVTRPVFRVVKHIPDTPYWAQLQNKYGRRKHL